MFIQKNNVQTERGMNGFEKKEFDRKKKSIFEQSFSDSEEKK